MHTAVLRGRALALAIVLAIGTVSSCEESEDEAFARIARAVALKLDSLNGLPTAVLDEYRCAHGVESCRERQGYESASLLDASAMTSAFADARGISIIRFGEGSLPTCPWFEGAGDPIGLWAEFTRPPLLVEGDSARVSLATVCMESAGFEQVHDFLLHYEDGEWRVVLRQLNSIT